MSPSNSIVEYTGTCFIGIVGADHDYPECRDSIQGIYRNGNDEMRFVRATKGYEARQMHLNNFMASKHDFLLLLDHDQVFPADTLERLRGHKLPYVSGYYLRRRTNPILPVWFEYNTRNTWPMFPFIDDPEPGKLVKLGASGWGCLLVHRAVIEAVRPLLKGEPEIIEDDCDLYPYDLTRIFAAIRGLEELSKTLDGDNQLSADNIFPAMTSHLKTLREEIRPLRCKKDPVGSDLRFPFFAREAGFTLWGDPDVRCGHMLNYNLQPDDYARNTNEEIRGQIRDAIKQEQAPERQALRDAIDAVEGKTRKAHK